MMASSKLIRIRQIYSLTGPKTKRRSRKNFKNRKIVYSEKNSNGRETI